MSQAAVTAQPVGYGVPVHKIALVPHLARKDALLPFEQDQLNRLIGQLNASSPRVKTAFLKHIRSNRLK